MRREPRQATTNQATTNQSDVFRLTEELLRLPRRRPYRYSKSSSNNNINNNNVLAILFSSVSSTKNKNHHQPHYDKFRRSAHCFLPLGTPAIDSSLCSSLPSLLSFCPFCITSHQNATSTTTVLLRLCLCFLAYPDICKPYCKPITMPW